MSGKDLVRVSGWNVERQVLDDMGKELRLYQSHRKRLEYLRKRLPCILEESPPPSDGMPRGSGVGNPVLSKIVKMEKVEREITEITTWLDTVEEVLDILSDSQRKIIDNLYLKPRNEREFTMVGLAKQLSMSESEAYRTKDEALLEYVMVLKGTDVLGGNSGESREAR